MRAHVLMCVTTLRVGWYAVRLLGYRSFSHLIYLALPRIEAPAPIL